MASKKINEWAPSEHLTHDPPSVISGFCFCDSSPKEITPKMATCRHKTPLKPFVKGLQKKRHSSTEMIYNGDLLFDKQTCNAAMRNPMSFAREITSIGSRSWDAMLQSLPPCLLFAYSIAGKSSPCLTWVRWDCTSEKGKKSEKKTHITTCRFVLNDIQYMYTVYIYIIYIQYMHIYIIYI